MTPNPRLTLCVWAVLATAATITGKKQHRVQLDLNQDLLLEQQQQLLQQHKSHRMQMLKAKPAGTNGFDNKTLVAMIMQQQQRSSLLSGATNNTWTPGAPITNHTIVPLKSGLDYLRQTLQMAIEVEHSVIPPYLTALYSIKPDGTDDESWMGETILGVVIEEMLHMTIAANTLNAVGGHPAIDREGFVPKYPMELPDLNITVGIEPMSMGQAKKFRAIELPFNTTLERLKLQAQPDSISEVYGYVIKLMQALVAQHGEKMVFTGDPANQIAVMSPRTGESVSKITNISGAIDALLDVVEQGAGMSPTDINAGPLGGQFAHFARFEEMYMGQMYQKNDSAASGPTGEMIRMNWTKIYQFKPNPVPENYPEGTKERLMLTQFAANYTQMLSVLHACFNGSPTSYYPALEKMYQLSTMATNLMKTPDPRFPLGSGLMLGPPWLWLKNVSKYADDWKGYTIKPPHPQWGC